MKRTFLKKGANLVLAFFLPYLVIGQTIINGTVSNPDLGAGTNYTSCSTPGTLRASFTVAGLPTSLSATFALAEFKFTINIPDGSNDDLANMNLYLQAPDNTTCIRIFNATNILDVSYGNNVNFGNWSFILKDNSIATCLDLPDEANFGTNDPLDLSADGNAGVLGVTNLTSTFSGINPNGTWELYSNRATQTDLPTLVSASITFGNPATTNYSSASDGKNCANAIVWTGAPFCAGTYARASSVDARGEAETPGANTGDLDVSLSTFAAGGPCDWNASADNTTWIKFVAQQSDVCIGISGLSALQQSIVVTNPSGDGSTCPANGEGWAVVNCPNNAIYSGTSGSLLHHNHCFTATIGNTYYLVVDGAGGISSNFYVNGIQGIPTILPIELTYFRGYAEKISNLLQWETASEINSDYFSLERSNDGFDFYEIARINAAGNSNDTRLYQYKDETRNRAVNYYRLRQVDFDGSFAYSKMISITADIEEDVQLYPNPNRGVVEINGMEAGDVKIMDAAGRIVMENAFSQSSINISSLANGMYFLQLRSQDRVVIKYIIKK